MRSVGAPPGTVRIAAAVGAVVALAGTLPCRADDGSAGSAPPSAAAARTRRVLVVQSFGRGVEPYESLATDFREALPGAARAPIEFHDVTLATALSAGEDAEETFIGFLRSLGTPKPLDLIVTIGGPATRFVLGHRDRVLPSTPLLIAGAEKRHVPAGSLRANDAYIELRLDIPRVLDNVFRLRPATSEVVLVFGSSALERYWSDVFRRELEPYAGRARTTILTDVPFREILARVARLPGSSAVLYGFYTVDADGAPYSGDAALAAIRAASTAPVFGVFESHLGKGIVGGPLLPVRGLASISAGAAARILGGSPPARERSVPLELGAPTYDARELRRFGIDPAGLPAGSAVRFRTASLWETHRAEVLAAVAVGVGQAALIAALAISLRGRRRAERRLRRSREQYALALDGANDGMWDWDVASGAIETSARCREILGLPAGAARTTFDALMERIHPDDRERVRTALQDHLDGKQPTFRVGHRSRHADGTLHHCFARGKALRDAQGRPHRVVGSVSDVTELRMAEERVRDVSRRLLVAQEDERARLARDLHDDITQRLARLAIDAGRLEIEQAGTGVEPAMRGLREGLVGLSEDVHAVSYRLHPSLLEDLGLAEALQAECERFGRMTSLAASLEVRGLPARLPRDVEICLYRVAQEALRNVDRHARARSARVRLERVDGGVQLSVHDDGVGFDPRRPPARPSVGHASMRERVHLVGGEIDIESEPGRGTTVLAYVPLAGERT